MCLCLLETSRLCNFAFDESVVTRGMKWSAPRGTHYHPVWRADRTPNRTRTPEFATPGRRPCLGDTVPGSLPTAVSHSLAAIAGQEVVREPSDAARNGPNPRALATASNATNRCSRSSTATDDQDLLCE